MIYTVSDLQLSDKSLYNAIIQVARELKKSDKKLCDKLLSNINNYSNNDYTIMISEFQKMMIDCAFTDKEKQFNVCYFLENNKLAVKNLIIP